MLNAQPQPTQPPWSPVDRAREILRAWRDGEPSDAPAVLRAEPELLQDRSVVIDLAYEDYCLREEAGQAPDADEFCNSLPAYRSLVREVIRGHRQCADHPEIFAPPVANWPAPGDTFEGLTLVRELGRGSFARAYLAEDPHGARRVVLKLSRQGFGEGRALGPVDHPNIVRMHWARPAGGLYAVCMPYVGRTTLRDIIDFAFAGSGHAVRTGLTVLTAIATTADLDTPATPVTARTLTGRETYCHAVLTMIAGIAGAVAHLHEVHGFAHGDLKPANVIVGEGGHPYLIDFNLARRRDDPFVRMGGTLPYMSPEVLSSLLRRVDTGPGYPADVFAVGVLLWEALTGRLPLTPDPLLDDGAAAAELLGRHSAGTLKRLASPAVSSRVTRLVRRCLDPDPNRRPTANQLERELLGLLPRPGRIRTPLILAGSLFLCGFLGSGEASPPPQQPQVITVHDRQKPNSVDGLVERGVAFLRENDDALALRDLDEAHRARPDGPSTALLAFCHARMPRGQEVAVALYTEAWQRHGYAPAWVHANRAYGLLLMANAARTRKEQEALLVESIAAATRALDGRGGERCCQAARLTRADAHFRLARVRDTGPTSECVMDIRTALESGKPVPGGVYYTAASILAAAGPDHHDDAIRFLRRAIQQGRNPRFLADDPVVGSRLKDHPDFRSLLSMEPLPVSDPPGNPYVVDPPELAKR